MKSFLRLLRGAVGNAMVWGTAWFGATLVLFTIEQLVGGLASPFPWLFILKLATMIGVTGFLTGGVFSAFLGFAYRDRPLLEIKVRRFALGGAIIAGLFSTVFTLIAGMSVGTGIDLGRLMLGVMVTAVLGGGSGQYTFTVTLELEDPDSVELGQLKTIIEDEKPAHTSYTLQIVPKSSQNAG